MTVQALVLPLVEHYDWKLEHVQADWELWDLLELWGQYSPQDRGEESAPRLQQCACRTESSGNLGNCKSTVLDLSCKIHQGGTERQCENVWNGN